LSLRTFAQLLGLKESRAEDALHSERAARAVLSRRNFFAASGALATGVGFSFLRPNPDLSPFMAAMADACAEVNVGLAKQMAWAMQLPFSVIWGGESETDYRAKVRRELRDTMREVLFQ
jgi:hypothetical protein